MNVPTSPQESTEHLLCCQPAESLWLQLQHKHHKKMAPTNLGWIHCTWGIVHIQVDIVQCSCFFQVCQPLHKTAEHQRSTSLESRQQIDTLIRERGEAQRGALNPTSLNSTPL